MLFASPHILIFVALLLVHYGVDGVQITGLSARKHGPGNGPPAPAPAPPAPAPVSTTTSPINTSPNQSSPLPSQTSGTSVDHTASTSLSSGASSLATSASNSEASLAESRKIGTIVGAVLGSVILSSLCLMTVAHFRRRARKARKQPRGSNFFNEPETEMSQTQNGLPLTSSAPLVHRPEPLHFFNSPSSSMNNTTLSPLIPAATFLDATLSSSRRPLSTIESDRNSEEQPSDPLQSPFDTHDLSLDTPLLERAVSAGPALPSTSSQLSPLHRDMVGFQKSLEANHKRDISDQSQSSTSLIGDPPPKYIG